MENLENILKTKNQTKKEWLIEKIDEEIDSKKYSVSLLLAGNPIHYMDT